MDQLTKVASEARAKAGQTRPGRRRYVGRILLLVLVIAICLILQERRTADQEASNDGNIQTVQVKREGLAGPAEIVQDFANCPIQFFPANIPWRTIRQTAIRREQAIEQIIKNDPTVFLQMCLDRYDREVEGYSCTLVKRERVKGKLKPLEVVDCCFREHPFSVFMNWKQGAGKARRILYVKGQHDDKMLARPSGLFGVLVVSRDVDAADVKASGRYLVNQFGIKLGTVRTLKAMRGAKERDALHVRYEGVFRVHEVGDRLCYKIVRTPYDPPEDEEGVNELTIFIDVETWLQVGSILRDSEGKLIAEYFFRDVKLNPEFKPEQFTRAAL